MPVEAGQEAPDFELPDQQRNKVKLSDYRGQSNVALVFYPFTFTGVCQGELCQLRDDIASFEAAGVQVLAVSCDSPFAQAKWAEEQHFNFPLLSDFWPHGSTSRAYGVFNEALGCAMRHTFVIDKDGKVAVTFATADLKTPRAKEEYEKALASLAA
jgi:peroxiredoxin (alkyl hydroperoxide reductase subunit C)